MFGNVLRRAVFVAAFFALLSFVGCHTVRPPHEESCANIIVTGGTIDQRESVRNALGFLEKPVQRAVRSVRITDHCPHYKPRDVYGNTQEAAHCEWTGDICIRPEYVRDEIIWHEAGHALMMSRCDSEQEAFTAIGADAYGNVNGQFPRDGFLTQYAATNSMENYAEWVRWAMCYLYRTPTGRTDVDLSRVDASDPRYLAHLQALRDWGAISDAQYNQLEPIFTVRFGDAPMK